MNSYLECLVSRTQEAGDVAEWVESLSNMHKIRSLDPHRLVVVVVRAYKLSMRWVETGG